MCFTLYLASNKELPVIQFDLQAPSFNTTFLQADEMGIQAQFSLPHILCIGSDQGCGCGFRHSFFEYDEWIPVLENGDDQNKPSLKNHHDLYYYLVNNQVDSFIEIYACWNGDMADPCQSTQEINASELLSGDFYFQERGLYKIKIND